MYIGCWVAERAMEDMDRLQTEALEEEVKAVNRLATSTSGHTN